MALRVHKYFLGIRDKMPEKPQLKFVTCVEAGGHRWLAVTNGFSMHLERVPEQEELEPGAYLVPVRFNKSPQRELFPVRHDMKPWPKLPPQVEQSFISLERCTWEYTDTHLLEPETIQALQHAAPDSIVAYIGVSEGVHKVVLGSRHALESTPNLAFYNAGYVLKSIRWLEKVGRVNAFCILGDKQNRLGVQSHSLTLATYGQADTMPSTQETIPSKMAVIMGMYNPALSSAWHKDATTQLLTIPDEKPKEQEEPVVEASAS